MDSIGPDDPSKDATCSNSACHVNPKECLIRVLKDSAIIAGTYCIIAAFLKHPGTTVTADGLLLFFAAFVPISFTIRAMKCEYSDQLERVAIYHLSTRIFNALTVGS